MQLRVIGLLVGCLATTLLSPALLAQTAAKPPPPQVGDRYVYEARFVNAPCSDWVITSVSRAGEIEANCEGWRAYGSTRYDNNPVRVLRPDGNRLWQYDPYFPTLDFPLQVGKRWSNRYEGFNGELGASWTSQVECLVEAYEEGEHPQFRIRCDDTFRTLLVVGGTYTSIFWYSPELGRLTRQVHQGIAEYSWRMVGW